MKVLKGMKGLTAGKFSTTNHTKFHKKTKQYTVEIPLFYPSIKVSEEGCKGEPGTVSLAVTGLQTKYCFPLLAAGGSPGLIQR